MILKMQPISMERIRLGYFRSPNYEWGRPTRTCDYHLIHLMRKWRMSGLRESRFDHTIKEGNRPSILGGRTSPLTSRTI